MKNILRITRPLLILLLVSFLFGSCAVWDFVRIRYQNVTGYFNTYYNASKLFQEALDEINKEEESKDLMIEKTNPFIFNIPPATVQKFDKVIEKCSKLLNDYSESKWVDNALLLIGKCYYYKQEYGRADRKFNELLQTFPKSNLIPEAQLWLGKTYFMLERDEDATQMIEKSILTAKELEQPEVVSEGYFTLGDMALYLNKQSETLEFYKKGINDAEDKSRKARIQFMLARLEEKLGNKNAARMAYLKVLDYNPPDKMRFNAEIQYVRLSRELGDFKTAFMTLVQMLETPRFIDYDAQIQLNIGHTLAASGDYKTAIEQYKYVDTTFKGKPEAAEAYYSVARIYEYQLKDYDNAAENYTKAKFEFPGSEFGLKGGRRADDFMEYQKLRRVMYDVDTLLFYVLNPDTLRVRDSLKTILDSIDLAKKIREGYDPLSEGSDRMARLTRRRSHGRNTGKVAGQPSISRPDQTVSASAPQPGANQNQPGSAAPYRSLKLSSLQPDSLSQILSRIRFDMGAIMFSRLQNYDSARYYYQLALQGSLEDSKSAQAYYTLAQIHREEGDSLKADSLEMFIISKYPFTAYGHKLMLERNMPIALDSSALALQAYNIAARHLEEGRHEKGIQEMKKVIERYPFSEQAVRARLAIGMTYETQLADKENMLNEYRYIAKEFPNSKYSKRPKEVLFSLTEYEKEKEKPPATDPTDASKKVTGDNKNQPVVSTPDNKVQVMQDTTGVKKPPVRRDPTNDPDFPLNPNPSPKKRIPE